MLGILSVLMVVGQADAIASRPLLCVAADGAENWPQEITPGDLAAALRARVAASGAEARVCSREEAATSHWRVRLVEVAPQRVRFEVEGMGVLDASEIETSGRGAQGAAQLVALAVTESVRPALQIALENPDARPPPVPPAEAARPDEATLPAPPTEPMVTPRRFDIGFGLLGAWRVTPNKVVGRARITARVYRGALAFVMHGGGGLWPDGRKRGITVSGRELEVGAGVAWRLSPVSLHAELVARHLQVELSSSTVSLGRERIRHDDVGALVGGTTTLWQSRRSALEVSTNLGVWRMPLRVSREDRWLARQSRLELELGLSWSATWD